MNECPVKAISEYALASAKSIPQDISVHPMFHCLNKNRLQKDYPLHKNNPQRFMLPHKRLSGGFQTFG